MDQSDRSVGVDYWRASETLLVVVQWKTRYVYTYICICNSTGRSEIRDKFHEC